MNHDHNLTEEITTKAKASWTGEPMVSFGDENYILWKAHWLNTAKKWRAELASDTTGKNHKTIDQLDKTINFFE